MSRAVRLIALLLVALSAAASDLEPAMSAVEEIRGRRFTSDVTHVTIDRSELPAHLRRQLESSTPYSLADWGRVLKALQLVDGDNRDLVPQLMALYDAQVLAFYDTRTHTYYSIRQMPKLTGELAALADPKMLEETVMVHELTHALQDQLFALDKREKALMRDTDANLAYHAVLEGEAVLVMLAQTLRKSGIDFDEVVDSDDVLALISSATLAEGMIDPSTPRYLAESLKFPYFDGLKFVVAAYRRGGWKALDAIHADPPRTTREVLHPEEYFDHSFKPRSFDSSTPAGAISAEHLGEFHWRFLVGAENARGWVDDRAVIGRDGRVAIDTEWESAERASTFANAYAAFLKQRGLEAKVKRDGSRVHVSYTAK